jgi:hypothetical protein
MHPEVRQLDPGKCPKCGMDLLPEGTRFAMLRHMMKRPLMLFIMLAVMAAIMIAIMAMMR